MPRKRKGRRGAEPELQDPRTWQEEAPPEYEVDPGDQEISEAFAQLPQNDPCIELHRTSKVGGRPVFLEQLTPALLSPAYIAEKFGGGIYVARARYKDGTPVRCTIEIAGDPFPVQRSVPNPAMAPVHSPAPPAPQEPLIVEGDDKGMAQVLQYMIRRMEQSETAFLEKMKLYKELFGAEKKQETPLDVALQMFQRGLDAASMTEGGASPWMMLAREFKDPLLKIVDTVQLAVARAQPPGARPPGAGAGAPPTKPAQGTPPRSGAPENPEPGSPPTLAQRFAGFCPLLLTAAARNADPGSYAGVILDQVPQSAYPQLYDWLKDPRCLEQLMQIEPGIRFQAEWWEELRTSLVETLGEELGHADRTVQPAPDSESPAVDSADGGAVSGAGGGSGHPD